MDEVVIVVLLFGFSKRYHVTFKHEVRADDPLLTGDPTGTTQDGTVQV